MNNYPTVPPPPYPPPPYPIIEAQPNFDPKVGHEHPALNPYPPVLNPYPPVVVQPLPTPVVEPLVGPTDVEKLYVIEGDRLIYDFEKVACCPGQHTGLDYGVESQVPTELAEKGIELQEWASWVNELREAQKRSPTICGCLIMFCFPWGPIQACFCAMCCPISMAHPLKFLPCCYGDWYDGLRKWMLKVNSTLNTRDMHAKLVTYKPFAGAPRSRNFGNRTTGKEADKYEMSFLVIALTKEESVKLRQESWDHGVNDNCTSGVGRLL